MTLKTIPKSTEARIFEKAQWIWPINHHWDIANSYALFRRGFELKKVSAKAPFYITADQSYRLFVNGQFVGRGPARGFQSHWPYDEINLSPYLKKGRNVLAIRAHHPGRSTFQYITQGFAGLLVSFPAGNIVSDKSWKSLRQESTSRDTIETSYQLFSQEHVDLRKEEGNWIEPGFDDSKWSAPVERLWNSGPWFSLEPRGIPLLNEKLVDPVALLGEGTGTSAPGYQDTRDVVALRFQETRGHQPSQATFQPLTVPPTGPGQFRSYLFDFGRTVVGNLTLTISGAAGGEILDTHCAERIDPATLTPDLQVPGGCEMRFGDRLICRAGTIHYSFYHHYGFRYLTLTVRDSTEPLEITPKLSWTGYPLDRKGSFASSDKLLEQIWETSAWTEQCCALDAYVDTPWREQAQWWGDARVQAWNTFYLNGDPRLFRRGISQIADQTTPDGVTYGHSPTMAHQCILPDFTLIWFLTIWDYYWQTGSTEPLLAHHATIEKALHYFEQHTDPKTGLITYDPRYWLFLDWTDIFKDGAPAVYNLWLLISLEKLALLYRTAKRPREAVKLEAWARKLRVSLAKLVGKDGLVRDGIDRKGKVVQTTSIHAQVLGLMAELKGINEKLMLEKILLPYIRGTYQPKVTPSAYWVTYVFTVLQERGYGAEVVAFIRKHWEPMVEHGTTWENFAPNRYQESFSHAWSAHPLYHLMQIVGGISQLDASWSKIKFEPTFVGEKNETVVPSPRGKIISRWRRTKVGIDVELVLPAGVTAAVKLPGVKARGFVKGGKWSLPASTTQ